MEYAVARLNTRARWIRHLAGATPVGGSLNPTSKDEAVETLKVVPSGTGLSIYFGGEAATSNGLSGFTVAQLTAAGRLDTTYGNGGFATRQLGTTSNTDQSLGGHCGRGGSGCRPRLFSGI